MKLKNLILLKPSVFLILLTGCIGTAQTEREDNIAQTEPDSIKKTSQLTIKSNNKALAIGHKEIRRLLGNDIGDMQFDTNTANAFRNYITNSLLSTHSYNSDKGYGSSSSRSSYGKIQFCPDGTFVETLSSQILIDTEGSSATASGANSMPGYWEVAALPNGMLVILMYSTHPRMLEDSANGFLPFIVAKHTRDFVALPNGDGYHRIANSYCK